MKKASNIEYLHFNITVNGLTNPHIFVYIMVKFGLENNMNMCI